DNPEVQRLIIEASAYWVRAFDIDGFRVDAAGGPRERASEFWPRWRAELKRIKPDLLLLAEASARDHYYVGHGFDAAYDWTRSLDNGLGRTHSLIRRTRQLACAGPLLLRSRMRPCSGFSTITTPAPASLVAMGSGAPVSPQPCCSPYLACPGCMPATKWVLPTSPTVIRSRL